MLYVTVFQEKVYLENYFCYLTLIETFQKSIMKAWSVMKMGVTLLTEIKYD